MTDLISGRSTGDVTTSGPTRLLVGLLSLMVVGLSVLARDRAYLEYVVPLALGAGLVVVLLWIRGDLRSGQILALALAFRLVLLWLPPSLSDDAFRYVWDGLIQVAGFNPYAHLPSDAALEAFHGEPIFELLNSKDYYTVYPPVSQLIFAIGGLFYRFGWEATYYAIKLILVAFEVGGLLLLARLTTSRALLLYAWNPLVLLETAGQAHTENLLIFFLVATVFLARSGRGRAAGAALACAGWVKLVPLVALPFLWRRFRWQAVLGAGLPLVLLALPYAAPYVLPHVRSSLDLYARLFEFNAGVYYAIKEAYRLLYGIDWSKTLGPLLRTVFLLGLPVLYVLDARLRWSLERALFVTLAFFLVCATTVHPWYLLGLLVVAVMMRRAPWSWYWLGLSSLGTYLLYVDGPYWLFVVIGWGGWLLIGAYRHGPSVLQAVQRVRGWRKATFIGRYLPRLSEAPAVLDLGAGEGYVGAAIARMRGAAVTLVDVIDLHRVPLPFVLYDGRRLPLADKAFDVTVLYFVLHHAEDPERVLDEALRVTRGRVIVVESVYEGTWDLRLLTVLDRLANRLRSGGRMRDQEEHLVFRTVPAWRELFRSRGLDVLAERCRGRWIHKQAVFVLGPPAVQSTSVIATQKNDTRRSV